MNKLFALLLLIVVSLSVHAQPSAAIVATLQKSIVRVESGQKVGTGFLWRNRNWVVTTMHLIADKNNVKVTLHNGVRNARVIRSLREHDLVLLELESASPSANLVLTATNHNPPLHSSLYTVGYNGNGNLNTIIDRSLRLGFSSSGKLEGLLPLAVRNELSACKMPNPAIQILYLDGTLLPGFSGAPIVDDTGHLVGIADGGLDKGASSISWGVRAAQLQTLETSGESLPTSTACTNAGQVRFAADKPLDESNLQVVKFDGFTFVKTKTRTVAQMRATIDDPTGLQQLLTNYANNNSFDYLNFNYDIYEDLRSGATLCVPNGSKLTIRNGMFEIYFAAQKMAFVAWPTLVTTPNDNPIFRYNPGVFAFQQKIVARDAGGLVYQFDPASSYSSPLFRWDGTTVNRVSYAGFKATLNAYGQAVYTRQVYSFQTLIGRGNYFLGAAALNDESTDAYFLQLNQCVLSGQCRSANPDAGCSDTCGRLELYAKLVLGVHMVGFSNLQATVGN